MNLRIIAGTLKDQLILTPKSDITHPMSEKIRGAVFSLLGDINDLKILDAYAGSGSFGFEAISRGASSCLMIENSSKAQTAVEKTINQLDLSSKVSLVRSSNLKWNKETKELFDIVFLDPPYDKIQSSSLLELSKRVTKEGLIILSIPSSLSTEIKNIFINYQLLAEKTYGSATILVFRLK